MLVKYRNYTSDVCFVLRVTLHNKTLRGDECPPRMFEVLSYVEY